MLSLHNSVLQNLIFSLLQAVQLPHWKSEIGTRVAIVVQKFYFFFSLRSNFKFLVQDEYDEP